MEIKRLEGLLLQHAAEQAQSLRAERANEMLKVKVLSTVPNVLLDLSMGSEGAVKARVSYAEGSRIGLMLSNGFEINAENRSSLNLMVGDVVELSLENTNPVTFKILGLYRKNQIEEVLNLVLESGDDFLFSINPDRLKETVENSGLFYERKLIDLLLGKLKPEDVLKDAKAQLLQTFQKYVGTLSNLLGVDHRKGVEGLRELIKRESYTKQELEGVINGLFLEGIDSQEYEHLVRKLEGMGQMGLLRALEQKDLPSVLKELSRFQREGILSEFPALEKAFKAVQSLQEPVLRELLKAVEEGSEKGIEEAYRRLLRLLANPESSVEERAYLPKLVGFEQKNHMEEVKTLLELLRDRVRAHESLKETLKNLFLENLSNGEYVKLIKTLEQSQENALINALEKKDLPAMLKELLKKQSLGTLEKYPIFEKALAQLQSLDKPVIRELLKAVQEGSDRNVKEAYQLFKKSLEEGERLVGFERTKAQSMEQIIHRLEFMNRIQWINLTHSNVLYMPVYYQGGRGGLMFKGGKEYTAVFKLDYTEGFISGILTMQRNSKVLDVKLFTNQTYWAELFRKSQEKLKELLKNEGIKLRSLSVEAVQREKLTESMKTSLMHEGFFMMV
ncbi:MAG: hypothetical protein N3C57_00535 [Aquificaceae bacterium]|nr:hypothetical protein [Aquificaceae bacterium]